jgi:xanthine/CO dehydrogenase XdhC/CoxF family maturation factor
MKELREILEAWERVRQYHRVAALATIVKAKGSTYRRPGARMLMTKEGGMVGSISGGCLEGDVFEHAKKVMESGQPVVVTYDTTSDDDLVWGLGLGCAGVVHVLIESVPTEGVSYLAFLAECAHEQRSGVLATAFRVEGKIAAGIGSRFMMREDGTHTATFEDPKLMAVVLRDARETLGTEQSVTREYTLEGGSAEVFIEAVQPPVPLLVFGAGHDAIPLVKLAKEIGWNITVVDSRPAFVSKERFPQADKVVLCDAGEVRKKVSIEKRSVVVIMTHNYAHDRDLLRGLMDVRVRYLGVLGPKIRTDALLADLRKGGTLPEDDWTSRLYSPVGVDIGAETPEEIALSILGEIRAVLSGRTGGLLRSRKGPIHG